MKGILKVLMGCAVLSFSFPGFSSEEILVFNSGEDEALYNKLIVELRCLVCQNQNIADSDADLAEDLRGKTFDLIQQGKSEDEIKVYMRERYGDFVLYAPELSQKTGLLWFAPILLLFGGLIWFFMRISSQQEENTND